jgi:hypothetical protein
MTALAAATLSAGPVAAQFIQSSPSFAPNPEKKRPVQRQAPPPPVESEPEQEALALPPPAARQ